MKKKWTSGQIAAAIVGGILGACVLLIAFYVGVIQLVKTVASFEQAFKQGFEETIGDDQEFEREKDDWKEDSLIAGEDDEKSNSAGGTQEADDEYYDFQNDIKSDLSYQVNIKEIFKYAETNPGSMMTGNYPVVVCEDQKKKDRINNAIKKEIELISDHIDSIGENLGTDDSFIFDMESYVTYMGEDVLSVIYVENAYLNEEMYETYVVSVNIDVESGIEMTNSQILEIDDEFSIEFRKRSEKQNGKSETMDYYSDQEITSMMNDDSTLIIFYTPLGMEVGFNYYYGWVTVTYKDYAKYQNPL